MSASEAAESSGPAAPRIIGRPFPRGTSGNPGGRSKTVREITEMARGHGPAAIEVLVRSMGSRNERVALAAATELLNRAYGRAPLAFGDGDDVASLSALHLIAARTVAERMQAQLEAERLPSPAAELTINGKHLIDTDPNTLLNLPPALE